jgi:hypothetical protein
MRTRQDALIAYLATLGAIVVLSVVGGLAVALAPERYLDEVLAALGFIGMAVTGLIGVIGTFRPKGRATGELDEGNDQ